MQAPPGLPDACDSGAQWTGQCIHRPDPWRPWPAARQCSEASSTVAQSSGSARPPARDTKPSRNNRRFQQRGSRGPKPSSIEPAVARVPAAVIHLSAECPHGGQSLLGPARSQGRRQPPWAASGAFESLPGSLSFPTIQHHLTLSSAHPKIVSKPASVASLADFLRGGRVSTCCLLGPLIRP